MKWVRCINNDNYPTAVIGKIYEVIEYQDSRRYMLKIICDDGIHYVFSKDFEDVTAEVITNQRDKKLNDLGI